jgi:hypothetical protein
MNEPDKQNVRRWLGQFTVIVLFCLSVTAPAISLSSALPYFKAEQLLLPFVTGIYLWLLLAGITRKIRWNGMVVVGFLYCVCNAISIWYGGEILGHRVSIRDYYELLKVWLPVAFFTISFEAALSENSLRRLLNAFSVAILTVCIYAWSQFLGLGFTYRLNSYYSSGGHIDEALRYSGRVYGTMGNANVLGQLMSWCVVVFVLAALFVAGSRLRNSLTAAACLITLVMTGSRFGLLTVSVGLVVVFGVVFFAARKNFAHIALLLLFIPVFVGIYQVVASSNRRTLERYQTLRNPLQIDSLRERLDSLWQEEWEDFTKSPLVGHGPAKTFYTSGYSDSEYLGVLREKGLIGLFVFFGYYLLPLHYLWKGLKAAHSLVGNARAARTPATVVVIQAAFIMGVLALLMDLGMSTFYSPFLQGFLWLWLGLGARSAENLTFHPLTNSPPLSAKGFTGQSLAPPGTRERIRFGVQ